MRSPKLGLATILGLSQPLEAVLDIARAAKLDGIERAPHLTWNAPPERLEAVTRAAASRGLDVLAYGSYFGFPGHFDREHVEAAVATTRALGASRLRVWAESPTGVLNAQILASAFEAGYSGPLVLEFTDDDESKRLEERVRADVDFVRRTLARL